MKVGVHNINFISPKRSRKWKLKRKWLGIGEFLIKPPKISVIFENLWIVFNECIINTFFLIIVFLLIYFIHHNDVRCIYRITYSVSHLKWYEKRKKEHTCYGTAKKMVGGCCILFYELCLTRGLIIYVHNSDQFWVNSYKT